MVPAPLALLRKGDPAKRSQSRHQNPVVYPDSLNRSFEIAYHKDSQPEFSFTQTFPAPKSPTDKERSLWLPPPHYHLLQDEHFKVASGAGIWYLYNKKPMCVSKGESITIKARHWHWFEPDPNVDEPFAVLYRYETEYSAMEQRFFRNQFAYLNDCREQGVKPSIFQTMVFSMHNWMSLAIPENKFIPEWMNLLASFIITAGMGIIGQFLLGYKPNYDGYYLEKEKSR